MSGPTEPGRESKVMTLSPLLPPSSVRSLGTVGLTCLSPLQGRRQVFPGLWWAGDPHTQ